ncbi:cell division control protein, variant 2 [Entomophthora muscae]|uniref:Cell division control protein, variant 2 n=1 Tax=Entomophthora muscae TaxID=34485 RepID=A0ACC2S9T5_9FUNG|nr:cell division control protein, variant 2 [Entomophthora muscae]
MSTRMNSMSSNSSKTNDPKAGLYTQLGGYVGFDSISEQIQKKFLKRGFHLNIILVGESGMGKSTFVNTLFSAHLLDSKGRTSSAQPNRKTVNIEPVSHVLKENGVKLRLTIVDTPGYGDQVNNERCWEPIITYIKDQHGAYLKKELTATRDRFIEDTRIHLCLFFISPTGHSLKPIDILVLQKLVEVVNVVPVIAKSDCLTPAEKIAFKNRIKTEIEYHGINLYPYASPEDDDDDREINQAIRDFLPFAIVGSELLIDVDGAKVRGRKTRWGAINGNAFGALETYFNSGRP